MERRRIAYKANCFTSFETLTETHLPSSAEMGNVLHEIWQQTKSIRLRVLYLSHQRAGKLRGQEGQLCDDWNFGKDGFFGNKNKNTSG